MWYSGGKSLSNYDSSHHPLHFLVNTEYRYHIKILIHGRSTTMIKMCRANCPHLDKSIMNHFARLAIIILNEHIGSSSIKAFQY